jgi:hypothetical protein
VDRGSKFQIANGHLPQFFLFNCEGRFKWTYPQSEGFCHVPQLGLKDMCLWNLNAGILIKMFDVVSRNALKMS